MVLLLKRVKNEKQNMTEFSFRSQIEKDKNLKRYDKCGKNISNMND